MRSIRNYLEQHRTRALQIGCQNHPIADWLNVDIAHRPNVVFMDASRRFPIPENSIDYVFTEHMVEHIPLASAALMIQECWRVLKPGGTLRIATPDLAFLFRLYSQPDLALHREYLDFSRRYLGDTPPIVTTAVIVNNFFRDWGHQFIFDEETLRQLAQKAGFQSVSRRDVGESDIPIFKDIERHGLEITDPFNRLETMVFECRK